MLSKQVVNPISYRGNFVYLTNIFSLDEVKRKGLISMRVQAFFIFINAYSAFSIFKIDKRYRSTI